jgi:hypothetical protein
MSQSSNHLDELRSLVGTITADRQAQKDKEKREAWTKFVSLSTIILAVLAAIATQKGAGFSSASIKQLNEATFAQAQASDGWASYSSQGDQGQHLPAGTRIAVGYRLRGPEATG